MSEVKTVEERLSAIESNIEWLTGGYKDLAYDHLNGLIKRIEDIRTEVFERLSSAEAIRLPAIVSAIDDGVKKLEEERDKLRGEVLKDVTQEVLASLNDGSHGMVRVAGKPHPVLTRIK
jgi:hypothetical protein